MAETPGKGAKPLGLYDRPQPARLSGIEIAAIALSAGWLVLAGGFLLVWGEDPAGGADRLRFAMTALALFLPVGMIWVAAMAARASRVMRDESRRLQAAIDAIRHAYLSQAQQTAAGTADPSVTKKLDEIAAAQKKAEAALAMFTSARGTARQSRPDGPQASSLPGPAPEDQPSLALGTPPEAAAPPLATADMIRALNFPETAQDKEGFAALRRALRDRPTAQFVTAAQDVLTLLSQEGIYMDDLRPDMARPEVWRRFAEGARGRSVAALGGVHDRAALSLSAARMKQDPIFRDAAHHFLRLFDRRFAEFAQHATDAEISAFSETRTARAFMLLGRVAGTFD
jgi:hypothetical protein